MGRESQIPTTIDNSSSCLKLEGVIKYGGSSPGSLGRHLKCHKICATNTKKNSDVLKTAGADTEMTKDWVHEHCLLDLEPFSAIERQGAKNWAMKHIGKPLGTRKQARDHAITWRKFGEQVVRKKVQAVLAGNRRISLGTDAWKCKGSTKHRHYVAVHGWWVDENWTRQSVCLHTAELPARRNKKAKLTRDASAYIAAYKPLLEVYGLSKENTLLCITDHDATIRKSIAALGIENLGCGCHGFQLPLRHLLPPLKPKKHASASAEDNSGSDSDSEPESSSSSDSSEDEEVAPVTAAPVTAADPGKRAQVRDPERFKIREELTPLFKKARKILKFYIHHPDIYEDLEQLAKKKSLGFKRFERETQTRWSSMTAMLASVLLNTDVQTEQKKSVKELPVPLDSGECQLAAQLCGLMTPHLVGTRVLEKEGEEDTMSAVLPCWHGVISQLKGRVPCPDNCGRFGREEGGRTYYDSEELLPIIKRAAAWLCNDTRATFEKFIVGKPIEKVLMAATLIDPRFKGLHFADDVARQTAIRATRSLAFAKAEGLQASRLFLFHSIPFYSYSIPIPFHSPVARGQRTLILGPRPCVEHFGSRSSRYGSAVVAA